MAQVFDILGFGALILALSLTPYVIAAAMFPFVWLGFVVRGWFE